LLDALLKSIAALFMFAMTSMAKGQREAHCPQAMHEAAIEARSTHSSGETLALSRVYASIDLVTPAMFMRLGQGRQ